MSLFMYFFYYKIVKYVCRSQNFFFWILQVKLLKEDLAKMKIKYEKMKKMYGEVLHLSAKKDIRIAVLEERLKQQGKQANQTDLYAEENVDLSPYAVFFEANQLNELKEINHAVRFDSTFVRKMICFLYNDSELNDVPTLRKRTTNGNIESKANMSNEIHELIKGMLSLRLVKITKTDEDYLYRLNKLNIHISHGLLRLRKYKANRGIQAN